MNRRHFLHPAHLAAAAGQALGLDGGFQSPEISDTADEMAFLRFGRQAMATTFEVVLPFGASGATSAAQAALDEIDRLEDQLTVYRLESEVSRLNQRAGSAPIQVEENLYHLLSRCAQL